MSYKITDTIIVDNNKNIGSIGTALFAGPVIIGGGTSTGTVSQPLQVTGTNGAYIGGNLGIGSTNPSSKLWVNGDIYATGIVTAQVLNASKDPGTGIATDFTNSLFGNGWRVSAPGSTTYYKLATLPPGGGGNTFDHLIINGVLGAWTNGNQTPFEITFSNRDSFNYKYVSYGSVRSDVRIIGISTNSSVEIWAQHQASQFTKLVYTITNSIQAIVASNPTSTTTAPTGTTVFDSSTVTPRFIINESDNVGIGTATPTSKLQVVGDASVSGLTTTNNLYVAGVSTFTNGPVLIGTGTSTGTASQPLQVIGGAYVSGNLGIGTTNPTSKLDVVGNVKVTGIVTATTFVGALTGTATSISGGLAGNIVYQSGPNTTTFLANGTSNYILQSNGVGNAPSWVPAAPSGAVTGLVIRDSSNNIVGTSGSVTQLTFSSGLSVTGTTGAAGIATITLSSNIVGSALSISGISTFSNGPVLIGSGTSTGTASQRLQVTGGAYVSGNLGIGNTLPTSKLAVQGDARFVSSGQGDVTITHSSLVSTIKGTATVQLALGSNNNEVIRINNSSQVGIGTASPAFTADIAGDARVTSTNKMRFGGTAGTTNFYIQYNSTANSLDFVAG